MRSSREIELTDRYPIQVVTNWIGNSVAIAQKHYLQVTDAHFKSANAEGGPLASKSRSTEKTKVGKIGEAPKSTPSRTRTCNPLLRRQVLYPVELWGPDLERDSSKVAGLEKSNMLQGRYRHL